MNPFIKKILFPFYQKNLLLKKYWWRRLLFVLFFITIITSAIFPLYSTLRDHSSKNNLCWSRFNSDLKSQSDSYTKNIQEFGITTAAGFYQATDKFISSGLDICLDSESRSFPLDLKFASLFGVIYMLLASYGLQLIYYKIFIYVIFGKEWGQQINEKKL